MKHREARYVRVKESRKKTKDIPICLYSSLFCLKDDKKYSDLLPSIKNYKTQLAGYNSKERMGRLLFIKIINAYLHFFMKDLLELGETMRIPCKNIFAMKIILLDQKKDFSYLYDANKIHKNVIINSYLYDKFNMVSYYMRVYGTNSFRQRIVDAYRNGTRYNSVKNYKYGEQ